MEKLPIVILAAGKGTRFLPLTNTVPKPLIPVVGKPVLLHQIDSALPYINQIILIVGHLKEKIIETFGNSYKDIPISYAVQPEAKGSADAVKYAEEFIKGDSFLLIYGDDIYDTTFFEKCSQKNDAIIGMKVKEWQHFGILKVKQNNFLEKIIEKPTEFVGDLANIGVFKLHKEIFKYIHEVKLSIRNEFELTDAVSLYAENINLEVIEVRSGWLPLSNPEHLKRAEEELVELEKFKE